MSLLHVGLLSLIEGVTEFLPVSSTGHLILTAQLLHLPQTEAMKSFEIAIQLGAILAVVVLYGSSLVRNRKTLQLVCTAFLPTAIIGFLFHGIIKELLLGNITVVLASLFFGGIILTIYERWIPKRSRASSITSMTYRQACLIGVFQSIALIPGISRSAATIVGGELLGIERRAIVDFTFLLAIPTMAAATGFDLLKSASTFTTTDVTMILIGFVLSFIVAYGTLQWFLTYVKKHSFAVFGVYRMIIAVLFFLTLRS